ncbi:hypothetical protein PIB30_059576 [Stylosanthes scabra]|uniref:RRM domain-containing protein n=1 Tax=Stylosanthes scabra TaxID=79078 RepID=A0ABU6SLM1_9FABA|nr:hypothetical protein [Stylosanthes scabra]
MLRNCFCRATKIKNTKSEVPVVIDAATKRKNCNGGKENGGDLGRRRQWRLKAPQLLPDFKLFVGNLPFSVDSAQLAELFETVGIAEVVEVIYHEMIERSRCFGFVTMSSVKEAEAAKQQIDGYGDWKSVYEDSVAWRWFNPKGEYSVRSFTEAMITKTLGTPTMKHTFCKTEPSMRD